MKIPVPAVLVSLSVSVCMCVCFCVMLLAACDRSYLTGPSHVTAACNEQNDSSTSSSLSNTLISSVSNANQCYSLVNSTTSPSLSYNITYSLLTQSARSNNSHSNSLANNNGHLMPLIATTNSSTSANLNSNDNFIDSSKFECHWFKFENLYSGQSI